MSCTFSSVSGRLSTINVPSGTYYRDEALLVPPVNQVFQYDADGNMTHDAVWTYTYDAENQLVKASRTGESVEFKYDYMGRRVEKKYNQHCQCIVEPHHALCVARVVPDCRAQNGQQY